MAVDGGSADADADGGFDAGVEIGGDDGESAGAGAATRPESLRVRLRSWYRLAVVVAAVLPLAVGLARDRRRFLVAGRARSVSSARRRERAEFLLSTFVDLGPAFVKLGQVLSTRPDALPGEYVAVLSRLQDDVPPAEWSAVEPVVEAELGPVEEAFDRFDTDPISGASLGQVYTAVADGEAVAVKVLRPGVRRRVEADLRVLRTLVPVLVRLAPRAQAFTLENLAEEFTATLREEMDYAREARNLETVGADLADDPGLRVPAVDRERSTDRVLTMEYVEGAKIDDVSRIESMGVDREALVERVERAYIDMIAENGRFHADPHPGNIAVQSDGTVVLYDFGVVGELSAATRERILEFYVAAAREDVDALIDSFVEMGALDPGVDRELMREAFDVVIQSYKGDGYDEDRIADLVGEFQGTLYEFPLRLPQDLALVVRVSTVLEGVCRTLDPGFDFLAVVRDYVAAEGYGEDAVDGAVDDLRGRAERSLDGLVSVPPAVDRLLDAAGRQDLRLGAGVAKTTALRRLGRTLSMGLVLGAAALSTALLWAFADVYAATVAGGVTAVAAVVLWSTARRSEGPRVRPQFTRHELRKRD
ncbi:MAG: ABC1 kinase family protein [Halolamina sp.]